MTNGAVSLRPQWRYSSRNRIENHPVKLVVSL